MSGGNYDKILGKICRDSGLSQDEIEQKVEAKRTKLAGLISREGALQVIAAELGISFENEILKIDEILEEMRKVNTAGKIIKLFPVREYTNKKGEPSKVANMMIADDTSNIKVVLWDANHIGLVESGQIKEGGSVDINNASMRMGELHLGSFSEFKPSTKVFESVNESKSVKEKSILDFKVGDSVGLRAFIVQAFDPRFFHVCPECKKKALQEAEGFNCAEHGKVQAEKRALINVVLDDGTESIRAVLFHENIPKLGLNDLEDQEMLMQQKQNILGKEMVFSGDVRMNKFFNNPEFIISDVKELNLDELISSLESN